MFSRKRTAKAMIIVGVKSWVISKLWELIATPNQWTLMMENILDMLTINSDRDPSQAPVLNYTGDFPFTLRNAFIPSDNTGFVYILFSRPNPNFIYIGKTENLTDRYRQHNAGNGAVGTSLPENLPYILAGYITGLQHYSRS